MVWCRITIQIFNANYHFKLCISGQKLDTYRNELFSEHHLVQDFAVRDISVCGSIDKPYFPRAL